MFNGQKSKQFSVRSMETCMLMSEMPNSGAMPSYSKLVSPPNDIGIINLACCRHCIAKKENKTKALIC